MLCSATFPCGIVSTQLHHARTHGLSCLQALSPTQLAVERIASAPFHVHSDVSLTCWHWSFSQLAHLFFWVRVAFYSTCSSVICGSLWPIELPGDWTLSNAKHLFSQKVHACICISWKLLTKVCGGGGAVISCAMRKGRTSRLSFLWRWWRLACSWFVSRHLLLGCWENRLAPSTREVWSKGHSDVALTPMVMTF